MWITDRSNVGQDRRREGLRIGGMQKRIKDRSIEEQGRCRTGQMQDRSDTGQIRCRKGCIGEITRMEDMRDRNEAGLDEARPGGCGT